MFNQHESSTPVTGLTWSVTSNNPCDPTPWNISNNDLKIRYDIVNSFNCGGTCSSIQSGSATANIIVLNFNTYLNLDFDGIGELQQSNFDVISFYLDDVLIANAHAAGGNLGCQMGDVIKTYNVPSPYLLLANTTHKLSIIFSTNDGLYHTNSYYEVNLSFTY